MISQSETVLTVLYDAADARRFTEDRNVDGISVLPLTPAAEAALAGLGLRIMDSRLYHGRYAHYRDVIRGERLERALEAKLSRERGLSLTARQCLVDQAVRACHVSSRLWSTLRAGARWRVPTDEGWVETSNRAEAHRILLRRIFAAQVHYRFAPTPLWLRLALHVVTCLLLVRIGRARPIVFHSFRRGFKALVEDMERRNPQLWRIQFVPVTATREVLSRIARLCLDVWRGRPARGRAIAITVPPIEVGGWSHLRQRVLNCSSDPVARAGIEALWCEIASRLSRLESVHSRYWLYMCLARPRAVMLWDLAEPLNVLLAEHAKTAGAPVVLVCHTSVSAGERSGTSRAKRRHTRHLVAHDLADVTLVQSPYAEQAAQQYGSSVPRGRIRPLVWGGGIKPRPPTTAGAGRRTILHAGNYFEWAAYMPVCYETSSDFVVSLRRLTDAIAAIPQTKLVIRMKSNFTRKGEITEETLRNLLPQGALLEIRSSGSFYDDLAEADLVVSYHSTTIEEALLAGCPVLLLGSGNDYRHVPASTTVPAPQNKLGCYASPNGETLAGMLQAILARLPGNIPKVSEAHTWPSGTPGIPELSSILTDERLDRSALLRELRYVGKRSA